MEGWMFPVTSFISVLNWQESAAALRQGPGCLSQLRFPEGPAGGKQGALLIIAKATFVHRAANQQLKCDGPNVHMCCCPPGRTCAASMQR